MKRKGGEGDLVSEEGLPFEQEVEEEARLVRDVGRDIGLCPGKRGDQADGSGKQHVHLG